LFLVAWARPSYFSLDNDEEGDVGGITAHLPHKFLTAEETGDL